MAEETIVMAEETKQKQLLIVPKNAGLSESDKRVLLDCGFAVIEVDNPKAVIEAVHVAPIALSPDVITKALFYTVNHISGAREAFGRAICNYLTHGGFNETSGSPAKTGGVGHAR